MILSSEDIDKLGVCREMAAAAGIESRFVRDCVVREYQEKTLDDICRKLGTVVDEVVICAGIGTLTMTKSGNVLSAVRPMPVENLTVRAPLTQEQITRRENTCLTCDQYRPLADKCNICGCAFVISERVRSSHSRCPKDKW